MKIDRMGVLVLLAHLIITLAVIVIYAITVYMGKADLTLQTIIPIIIGYWFGSMGTSIIRPNAGTQINQANEVKVNPPNDGTNNDMKG